MKSLTSAIVVLCLVPMLATAGQNNRGGNDEQPGSNASAAAGAAAIQGQGQLQGQLQGQSTTVDSQNSNRNSSRSTSNSGSYSGSSAGAVSTGSSVTTTVGGHTVSPSSVAGDSQATVGAISNDSAGGEGGQGGAGGNSDSGDHTSSVTVEGSSYNTDYDLPVAQAATVFASQCQNGMSGQLENGGFSVIQSDQFCDYIRLAEAMLTAYTIERDRCAAQCVGVCTSEEASVELQCATEAGSQADYYLAAYHEALHNARDLIEVTKETAFIDRVAGHLTRPAAFLLALIFIL